MSGIDQSASVGGGGLGGPGGPPGAAVAEVDPELLGLPAPPRARRLVTITTMALVVAASLAVLVAIRADIAYFFQPATAVDLGEVTEVDPASLESNAYVRIEGTPMASKMVRYSRGLTGTELVLFPLAGQRHVFVQVPAEGADRTSSRREFTGRLVRFGDLSGRMSGVRAYLDRRLGLPVTSDTFVLMADEAPGSYAWALLLAALCALFVAIDVTLLFRWFRPLPARSDGS